MGDRQTETQRETDRQTDRDTEGDRQTDRETGVGWGVILGLSVKHLTMLSCKFTSGRLTQKMVDYSKQKIVLAVSGRF